MSNPQRANVVVVGGGLAGLATAAYAARGGRSVIVCEKAAGLGGRAATTAAGGFRFNLGAHALYNGGPAMAVLRELGVSVRGKAPSPSGAFAVARGAAHALPGGFLSLVTTGLFGLPAKLETARLLGGFAKLDPAPLSHTSVSEWLATAIRQPDVRALLGALVRVSSYTADHDRMSAGTALAQLQKALGKGVLYLDGGWGTLVEGLRGAAVAAGAEIRLGARVDAIELDGGVRRVRLANGTTIAADAVVIAADPDGVAKLLPSSDAARQWAADTVPVEAACLDIGLTHLPRPRATFALGIDRPLYLSVHSAVAQLAPAGAAMIHLLKYQPTGEHDAKADERELEGLLDLIQPGWRAHVVERRFLPRMIAANAVPTAAQGGVAGRPGPAVPGADGVYVVGDWVGGEALLADASLASARQAAALIAAQTSHAAAA
ncbi:MAG: FAD-dependent oxidoreductase [bacterium]